MLSGDNSVLQRATDAKEQTEIAQEKETISLAYSSAVAKKVSNGKSTEAITGSELNDELDNSQARADGDSPIIVTFTNGHKYSIDSNGNIGNYELPKPVTNPYDKDGWIMAWTCTNGVWTNEPIQTHENEITGVDIIAKLYETGRKTQPNDFVFGGQTFRLDEGNAYSLIIEGQGEMGNLAKMVNGNPQEVYAWQLPSALYAMGQSSTCIGPYITEIKVCDGITNIGDYAFAVNTSLNNIEISNTVKNYGEMSFIQDSKLSNFKISDNVRSIGEYSFQFCIGLTSVTIPNKVTIIEEGAFNYCTGLTSVTIQNGVTSIGKDAFSRCEGLTSITIPNSIRTIGDRAFQLCTGLTSVTIQNGVTSIGEDAFSRCEGLTSITIPNSIRTIGDCAFQFCTGLTSVIIQNGVTSIGHGTFSCCRGLTSIIIPNSITTIGECAFECCSSLTNVTIPNSVTNIGITVFREWTSSQSINVQFKENEIPDGWDRSWADDCNAQINYVQ